MRAGLVVGMAVSSIMGRGMWTSVWLFFFQAEDGIRDGTVTGVQTCALPISCWSAASPTAASSINAPGSSGWKRAVTGHRCISYSSETGRSSARFPACSFGSDYRSEERRVGKECKAGGSPQHQKKHHTRSTDE